MTTRSKVSTAKNRASRVKSDTINVSCVNVSSPAGAGVAAGGSVKPSTLPAVGGGVRKSKGRSNGTSQFEAAKDRENWDYGKLKSSLCLCFAAPVPGDLSERDEKWAKAVELGLMSSDDVTVARQKYISNYQKDHPAPNCTLSAVLELVHSRFASAWASVVGCAAVELTKDLCKVYDQDGTVVGDIDLSGTACQIITDILSYRNVVAVRRAAAWDKAVSVNEAVNGCHAAGVACFNAGLTEEEAIKLAVSRIKSYFAAERDRELIRQTDRHNAAVDLKVLDVLLCDALAAGRAALADKIRGSRKKVLRRLSA